MIIPIKMSMERPNLFFIVDVMLESTRSGTEYCLVQKALEILEKAKEFLGHDIQNNLKIPKGNQRVVVQFSIVFPSEDMLNSFVEFYNKK